MQAVLRGIRALMTAAHWTYDDFQHAMGIADGWALVMERVHEKSGPNDAAAYEEPLGTKKANKITFYDSAFDPSNLDDASAIAVHELAHVWDGPTAGCQLFGWGCLNGDMLQKTEGYSDFGGVYIPGHGEVSQYVSKGGKGNNPTEDFADAVAAYVYPKNSRYTDEAGSPLSGYAVNSTRWLYVMQKFAEYKR
jgi:hypothetical protein